MQIIFFEASVRGTLQSGFCARTPSAPHMKLLPITLIIHLFNKNHGLNVQLQNIINNSWCIESDKI